MKKVLWILSSLSVFALTAAVEREAAAAVGGPVCNVPTDYATIQSAINDAGCATINVAAGSYAEFLTIARPVNLRGPNAGISALTTRVPEARITSVGGTVVVSDGTDVTIDGFTIEGAPALVVNGVSSNRTVIQNDVVFGLSASMALLLAAPGSGVRLLDNDLISEGRSLHVQSGPYTDMKINGNRFSGAAADPGIQFANLPETTITGFEFNDNQVFHYANIGSNIFNAELRRNVFSVYAPGNPSIQIALHDAVFADNTFQGFDNTSCLQLFGDQYPNIIPSDHVQVTRNVFRNCDAYGVQLSQNIHHIDITRNKFLDGYDGVNTRSITPFSVSGREIHINENDFVGNTHAGISNTVDGILDGTCNWWGSPTGPGPVGPGLGDNVSTGVLFAPFLTAPSDSKNQCDDCAKKRDDDCKDDGSCSHGGGIGSVGHDGHTLPSFLGGGGSGGHHDDTSVATLGSVLSAADPSDGNPEGDGGCSIGGTPGTAGSAAPFALMLVMRALGRRRRAS